VKRRKAGGRIIGGTPGSACTVILKRGGKRGTPHRAADQSVSIGIHFADCIADQIVASASGRLEATSDALPERDMAVASPIRSRRYLSYAGSVLV
jgi:hypothetical protein